MVLIASGFTAYRAEFEERLAQLRKLKKVVPLRAQQKVSKQTETEIALGKELFNDTRFSKNNNVSCATCHIAEKGFSNGEAFATGTNGNTLSRHVPHLYNLALSNTFFWDGRSTSLEEQLNLVIKSKSELDMSFKEVVERLRQDTSLTARFQSTFPKEGLTKTSITRALVAYEKSIGATDSRYDKFLDGDMEAINPIEKKGLELFIGKANCIACHHGPNLTDNSFHNVGVKTNDLGRQGVDKIGMNKEFESTPYPFFSTFKAFKTPSLRNVAQTSPYFHNGAKSSLAEVVAFYNSGGENPNTSGLAKEIVPLLLSDEEQAALIAFLNTLSSPYPN